jgi:hypothetical protein
MHTAVLEHRANEDHLERREAGSKVFGDGDGSGGHEASWAMSDGMDTVYPYSTDRSTLALAVTASR